MVIRKLCEVGSLVHCLGHKASLSNRSSFLSTIDTWRCMQCRRRRRRRRRRRQMHRLSTTFLSIIFNSCALKMALVDKLSRNPIVIANTNEATAANL